MFVLNDCTNDSRVLREAEALQESVGEVRIYACVRAPREVNTEHLASGVTIERIYAPSIIDAVRKRGSRIEHAARRGASPAEPTAPDLPAAKIHSSRQHFARVLNKGMSWLKRSSLPFHRVSVYISFGIKSWTRARLFNPGVIHMHDLSAAVPGVLFWVSRRSRKYVYDSHELWSHRYAATGYVDRLFNRLETLLVTRVDAILTVSPGIGRWLEAYYDLPSPPIIVRNCAPYRATVSPAINKRSRIDLRESLGIDHDTRVLIYTGRQTSGRGLTEAVRALRLLPDDIHLVLMGYGPALFRSTLLREARVCGVEGRVHMVEAVPSEEVPSRASAADLALVAIEPVCLSYELCLPNKLFEALQARLPVVLSPLRELIQISDRFNIGEVALSCDATSIARAIETVISKSYGPQLEYASNQLCWEVEQATLLSAYKETLGTVQG